MSTSLPFAGRTAIVTGSSRGIGAAVAKRLASQGANVVINYVASAGAAQAVADEINDAQSKSASAGAGAGRAIVVQADAGSVADNKRLVAEALRAFGRIDSLVLNAGHMDCRVLADVDEQDFDRHFNTNVRGPLFLVQAAAPHMKAGGKVVLFSTSLTHASVIPPNYLVYAATKGAVEQMMRALSKDLGARGINVNSVAPGPIDTDLFRNGKTEERINFVAGQHPQKRLGQPEEVSNVVSFLVSDEASWVNGQTIHVNGAYSV